MFHPWRTFRSMAAWSLVWQAPASGARAECHWPSQTITIRPDLLQAEPRPLDGDALSYAVKVIEGEMPATGAEVSLFIDVIGRPLTPLS